MLGPFYSAGSKESGPRTYFKTGAILPDTNESAPEERVDLTEAVSKFAPGWTIRDCGVPMKPGLKPEWGGRENVLITHPLSKRYPCVLSRSVKIPSGETTTLVLDVALHSPRHDWTLVVRADGKPLLVSDVSSKTAEDLWRTVHVDLSSLAGKTVLVELENQANNWACEAGYWSRIAVEHSPGE